MNESFIYCIQAGDDTGPVKVGITDSIDQRLPSLQNGNHLGLSVRALISCKKQHVLSFEKALHTKMSKYHIRGEWFEYNPMIANIIQYPSILTIINIIDG